MPNPPTCRHCHKPLMPWGLAPDYWFHEDTGNPWCDGENTRAEPQEDTDG